MLSPINKACKKVSAFNDTLTDLIKGNADSNIIAAPSEHVTDGLQVVSDLWSKFAPLLLENAETVRHEDGSVDMTVLEEVAAQCIPLLKKSNAVVGELVNAARAAGVATSGLVVDIAGRQRMIIQRMTKEALLVAHGVGVVSNTQALRGSIKLFTTSHDGIVLGAPWAGIPTVTSHMCTLQQMREVTYRWEQFLPLLDQILVQESEEKMQEAASQLAEEIADGNGPLFTAMVQVVKTYVTDDRSCNPIASIRETGWIFLLNSGEEQRVLVEKVSLSFMLIAIGVEVTKNKVDLSISSGSSSRNLRYLIEGSTAQDIPAPPTQQIADKLVSASASWADLENAASTVLRSDNIDQFLVLKVTLLSERLLDELVEIQALYAQAARTHTSLNVKALGTARRQLTSLQRMSKEACSVRYFQDAGNEEKSQESFIALNETRAQFTQTHWQLLLGAISDGIQPTTDVCTIQQMKAAADRFTELEKACIASALGSDTAISELMVLTSSATDATEAAANYYARISTSCEEPSRSFEEWSETIKEIGNFRALTQTVSYQLISPEGGAEAQVTMSDMETSVKNLLFGSFESGSVPSPQTQDLVTTFSHLMDRFTDYQATLQGRRLSVDIDKVTLESNKLTEEAESISEKVLLVARPAVPDHISPENALRRINIASRQIMLAHMIYKASHLQNLGKGSPDSLAAAKASFTQNHMNLLDGGDGLHAVIPEREDLLAQWDAVDGAYQKFVSNIDNPMTADMETIASLNSLVEELDQALLLYSILDPYVPPKPPRFPWTSIIMMVLGCIGCVVCTVGCIAGGVHRMRCFTSEEGKNDRFEAAAAVSREASIEEGGDSAKHSLPPVPAAEI